MGALIKCNTKYLHLVLYHLFDLEMLFIRNTPNTESLNLAPKIKNSTFSVQFGSQLNLIE